MLRVFLWQLYLNFPAAAPLEAARHARSCVIGTIGGICGYRCRNAAGEAPALRRRP